MRIPALSAREKLVLTRLSPSDAHETIQQLVAKDLLLERGAGGPFQLTQAGHAVKRQLTSKAGKSSFFLSCDEAERSPAEIEQALNDSIGNLK
jgi:hypothetical protein